MLVPITPLLSLQVGRVGWDGELMNPQLDSTAAIADHLGPRPLCRRVVTPIVGYRNGHEPGHCETGSFFRLGDASFLVTAAHVGEDAWDAGFRGLYVFDAPADGRCEPVPLNAEVWEMPAPSDVAVFELEEDVVGRLPGRQFLRLSDVCQGPLCPGLFWLDGYPTETLNRNIPGVVWGYEPLNLCTGLSPNDGDLLEGFDRRLHFLLAADRDDLSTQDGTPGQMPRRLNGISGCPVWQVGWPGRSGFDPSLVRVVGVQHVYHPTSSVIRATRWGAVAQVLWNRRPDLRGIIEMHLGLCEM